MGYYTSFEGTIAFDRPLDENLARFIKAFTKTRHVKRNVNTLNNTLNNIGIDPQIMLPPVPSIKDFGPDGMLFVPQYRPTNTTYTEDLFEKIPNVYNDVSVEDANTPPGTCPNLWADIELSETNDSLTLLDGKNYDYQEWLRWLIRHIFEPAGYTLNGNITWQGEDQGDYGTISVKNNDVDISFRP